VLCSSTGIDFGSTRYPRAPRQAMKNKFARREGLVRFDLPQNVEPIFVPLRKPANGPRQAL
jgi:hypothetical protein